MSSPEHHGRSLPIGTEPNVSCDDARETAHPVRSDEAHEPSRSGEPRHVVDRLERLRRWFDGYSDHRAVPRALDRGEDEGLELDGETPDEGAYDRGE